MSVAGVGAGACLLPAGAAGWAALTAWASRGGAALALALALALDLALDLAFAASDVIRSAPAQMRTAAIDMPFHQGTAPEPPMRLLHIVQIRFLAPGAAPPRASSSVTIVSSWSGRGGSALRSCTTTASAQLGTSRGHPQRHELASSH